MKDPVAYLEFSHVDHSDKQHTVMIHRNDELDVGRKRVQDAWGFSEPTVSNHHLRFRCVVFEDDDQQELPPLIYGRVLSWNDVLLTRSGSNNRESTSLLSNADGDVLFNQGDRLQLTPQTSITFKYVSHIVIESDALDKIKQEEVKRFGSQYYVTERVLGTGSYACVVVAIKHSDHRQVACKVVPMPFNKAFSSSADEQGMRLMRETEAQARGRELHIIKKRESLAREYQILKNLSHPNIITLEKVFCATYNTYILQELITGGDLLSYLDLKGALTEPQSAVIIRQVLKAVEYLHNHQVVHRDIKPENILVTSWRDGARVVLTDFGQARTVPDANVALKSASVSRMQSVIGTYGYTAPEVYQQTKRGLQKDKGYSKAIDIWSVGCVTATLLTGAPVFGEYHEEPADSDSLMSCKFDFMYTSSSWQRLSRKVKAFIKGCLDVDEVKRLTAKQALLNAWFTNKHYAADLDAAYERAIQDWQPRAKSSNLIEFIDTTRPLPSSAIPDSVTHITSETLSRQLPAQRPPNPAFNASGTNQVYHPPQKHKHTPLPPISEVVDEENIAKLSQECITRQGPNFTSPGCVSNSIPISTRWSSASTAQLITNDIVPPETQFTIDAPATLLEWPGYASQSSATACNIPRSGVDRMESYRSTSTKRKLSLQDLDSIGDSLARSEGLLAQKATLAKKLCQ